MNNSFLNSKELRDKTAALLPWLGKKILKGAPGYGKQGVEMAGKAGRGLYRGGKAYTKAVSKLPTRLQSTAYTATVGIPAVGYSLTAGMPKNAPLKNTRFSAY